MAYEVKTPLVIVRDETGASHYLYTGARVPDYVKADRLKELEDEGHIAKVGAPDPNPEKKAEAAEKAADAPAVPAKSASKGDWEAYARSKGATDADLDGKTKDELVTSYGA